MGWFGFITAILGLPGVLFDDTQAWRRLVFMSPTWSIFIAGIGCGLLGLFFIAQANQIWHDENARLHKRIRGIKNRFSSVSWRERWWYFRETSFAWLYMKYLLLLVFIFIFVLPPFFIVIFGGWFFWAWMVRGGELTYLEFVWHFLTSRLGH